MKAVIAVVVVLVLAGGAFVLTKNNDSDKDSSQSSSSSDMSSMDNQKSSSSSSTPSATNSVEIKDFAYSPANITIKKGTTVTWTNKDSTRHDVKETDGKKGPDSELLGQSESYSFTFDTVGSFAYFCSVHPNMTGTVTVTE